MEMNIFSRLKCDFETLKGKVDDYFRTGHQEKHPSIWNYSVVHVSVKCFSFLKTEGVELFNNVYSNWISEFT